MGQTAIEWADYTFNPWIGCTKVSDGCKNCYAEKYGRRFGVEWGPQGIRRRTSAAYWRQPLAWNAKAIRESTMPRVFCASLADVFEGNPQTDLWLPDLFKLIEQTKSLTWMLLTKRPENIWRLIENNTHSHRPDVWLNENPHVWIGTSVENQEQANKRIPILLRIPSAVRFLSCEPLLGPVELFNVSGWKNAAEMWGRQIRIDWVITGGESGAHARPMHPGWVRGLRDQCIDACVPFFFKQWGEFHPVVFETEDGDIGVLPSGLIDCDVKPHEVAFDGEMERIGKKSAGRLLDGRTWDEVPG